MCSKGHFFASMFVISSLKGPEWENEDNFQLFTGGQTLVSLE